MSSMRGRRGIPRSGPIPSFSIMEIHSPISGTRFCGESTSPIGVGQPDSPPDRVQFPCLSAPGGVQGIETLIVVTIAFKSFICL